MNKAEHTPGEWITKEGQIYPQETGKTIALIPYFDSEDKEQQANARLMASAPEMLEVLNLIYEDDKENGILKAGARVKLKSLINKINNQ